MVFSSPAGLEIEADRPTALPPGYWDPDSAPSYFVRGPHPSGSGRGKRGRALSGPPKSHSVSAWSQPPPARPDASPRLPAPRPNSGEPGRSGERGRRLPRFHAPLRPGGLAQVDFG